ncbi:tRNA-dihydrouridine(16) synthase [compost metagenome]
MDWQSLLPLIQDFWGQARAQMTPRQAPGRLKQWVAMLTRTYPEAVALFTELRRETDCDRVGQLIGIPVSAAA